MNRTVNIIILFFSGLVMVQGCSDQECISFATDIIVVQFMDSTSNSKTVDIQTVSAGGTDVIFYNDTLVSKLYLPVDTEETSTTFMFTFPDGSETLEVGYFRNVELISQDCGFELLLEDLNVIESSFPNAMVVNSEISTLIVYSQNRKNIEIYY